MSRSYRVLALALAAVLLLVGLAKLFDNDEPDVGAIAPVGTGDQASSDTLGDSATDESVTDVVDGDEVTTSSSAPPQTAPCNITEVLRPGATGEQVTCLEQQLSDAGYAPTVDGTFDNETDTAVRAYQTALALEVDGVVGRQTAQSLGIWAGPLGPMPATDFDCPSTAHGAIVDRANQRGALCDSGEIVYEFPITTAWSQPDPGTYPVYAKDLNASSILTGRYSTMTHFVAFTHGKYQGARIAFHSMPTYQDGSYVNPLDTVGDLDYRGQSSGCIRVVPDDAVRIWEWLAQGDEVHVIS